VLAAVCENGCVLSFVESEELKKDKEVVLAAVRQDGDALKYASKELQKDKEVVLAAVWQHCRAPNDALEELKSDKDVLLAAVRQNG